MTKESTLVVRDVLGPMPSDGSAVVFLLTQYGKVFGLSSSLSDADACHKSLAGESDNGPSSYQYMVDLIKVLGLELADVRLEISGEAPYSRLIFKHSHHGKDYRIVSPNPMMAVNFSMAAKRPLVATEQMVSSRADILTVYGNLKAEFGALWPLSAIKYSDQLQVLSELMDGVSCRTKSKAS